MKHTFKEALDYMERTGEIPDMHSGLCHLFFYWFPRYSGERKISDLMEPTGEDLLSLRQQGHDPAFWASDSWDMEIGKATGLRKTLVALCAAMNGEL